MGIESRRVETAVGPCEIAWTSRGIVRFSLAARTGERAIESTKQPMPAWVKSAIRQVKESLSGKARPLAKIPVDLEGVPPFHRRVYEVVRALRAGETATYGQIAARVGSPRAARAVGQALARNPIGIVVPCHRVLAAGGRPGGFSAPNGLLLKAKLLAIEGVRVAWAEEKTKKRVGIGQGRNAR